MGGDSGLQNSVSLANTSGVILNLGGNDVFVRNLSGGGTSGGNIVLGSGELIIDTVSGSNATFTGVISGTGSVVKKGYGSLTLAAANTYTGGTTISEGSMIVGINNALKSTGAVIVSSPEFNSGSGAVLEIADGFSQTIGTLSGSSGGSMLNYHQEI